MPEVVSFAAPYDVALVACDPQPLVPGTVRLRTWYSGISPSINAHSASVV